MKSIFVVHQYENYMYRDNYIPYKRAFLRKEEVIELLKEFNDEFGNLCLWGDFKSSDFPKFNKWIEENL